MQIFSRLVFGVALLVVGGSVTGRTQHDIADVVDSAKRGELLTLRNAVAAGADVTVTSPDGSTALLWASYRDDLEMARWLLTVNAPLNAANDLGVTPLLSLLHI